MGEYEPITARITYDTAVVEIPVFFQANWRAGVQQ